MTAWVAIRLDTPEILLQTFAKRSVDDRASLDEALDAWLRARRSNCADEIETLGERAYTKRVTDALTALQLLELPTTRERMRASLNEWLRWLHPLRTAPERDPELECWRLMAIGQSEHLDTGLLHATIHVGRTRQAPSTIPSDRLWLASTPDEERPSRRGRVPG